MIIFIALIPVTLFMFALFKEVTYAPVRASFVKFTTDSGSSFGIGEDGSLWVWGSNDHGQLGDGTAMDIKAPKEIIGSGVLDVVVSGDHNSTFIIKKDGSLWACGNNGWGQLGDGTTTDSHLPKQIIANGVVTVTPNYYHATYAIKTDGSMWAWGKNGSGELGDGTTTDSLVPKEIIVDGVMKVFSAALWSNSDGYAFAVKTDGSLWAWGNNRWGQLGDGTKTDSHVPKQIIQNGVAEVTTGDENSFALKTDGSLWAWGSSGNGQLGDGTVCEAMCESITTPKKIIANGVTAISALGYGSVFAIKNDGSLWAWGSDKSGQLGDGNAENSYAPKQVIASDVVSVAMGYYVTYAIKKDGSLWVWGSQNWRGKLGDGTTVDKNLPEQIISDGVVMVSTGGTYSFALKKDGSLWAWGDNGDGSLWPSWMFNVSDWKYFNAGGQLGDGTTIDRMTPKQINSGGGLSQPIVTAAQTITGTVSDQSPTSAIDNTTAPDFACGTSTVQDADGDSYNTVQVGDQCWMASNINVGKRIDASKDQTDNGKIEKWCPGDVTDNCKDYGGFYTWDEAMQYSTTEGAQGICPDNWHIPTDKEQTILENYLKNSGKNNTNGLITGSDSPLAGYFFKGNYNGQGNSVNFWSSYENSPIDARDSLIHSDKSSATRDISLKINGFSVRCIKN